MTKRTAMLAAWALALTAACSASPIEADLSDLAPLAELSAVNDGLATDAVEGDTVDGSQTSEAEAESLITYDAGGDLDDLEDMLGDLDDLLGELDGGIHDLEDSFDENEGDIEE